MAASFLPGDSAMLRSLSIAILVLAGVLVLCMLALRLVAAGLYALSGIRRRDTCEQVLSW
jgi:NADH:ubiquinone oxidoreductase subunit 2 (subunit N)